MSQNALNALSVQQLKRAVKIRERIERLQKELANLVGGAVAVSAGKLVRRKRRMSAAGRARIAAAAKARWAKVRAAKKSS